MEKLPAELDLQIAQAIVNGAIKTGNIEEAKKQKVAGLREAAEIAANNGGRMFWNPSTNSVDITRR